MGGWGMLIVVLGIGKWKLSLLINSSPEKWPSNTQVLCFVVCSVCGDLSQETFQVVTYFRKTLNVEVPLRDLLWVSFSSEIYLQKVLLGHLLTFFCTGESSLLAESKRSHRKHDLRQVFKTLLKSCSLSGIHSLTVRPYTYIYIWNSL